MRVYITITEEPVFINPFIKKVIQSIPSEIIGIAIVPGSLFRVKKQNRLLYLLTLALIMNPFQLLKNAPIMACFTIMNSTGFLRRRNFLSISKVANEYGIPVVYVEDVNSPEFIEHLRQMEPDVIINQAQAILKEEFLSVPKVGALNRHGALLPKYRGRLAPFWAYSNMEKETGVSIHFIERKLDSGPIIAQKRIRIGRFDSLDSLLKKIFALAPDAMLEALDIIRSGNFEDKLIDNDDELASYFSSPTLIDAIRYRKVMIRRFIYGE